MHIHPLHLSSFGKANKLNPNELDCSIKFSQGQHLATWSTGAYQPYSTSSRQGTLHSWCVLTGLACELKLGGMAPQTLSPQRAALSDSVGSLVSFRPFLALLISCLKPQRLHVPRQSCQRRHAESLIKIISFKSTGQQRKKSERVCPSLCTDCLSQK